METVTQELYEEISDEIHTRIKNKTYSIAQKLPSEYDLAKEFDVSRLTIRKAIDVLVNKNIVIKHKGKGTYIMQNQKLISGRGGLQSFTEAAEHYGLESKAKVLLFDTLTDIPEDVQRMLSVTKDAKVYHIKRVRLVGDIPMTIEDIYLPVHYLPNLTRKMLQESLFKHLESKNEIAYSHQEIEAKLVDAEISALLDVKENDPVFLVHSTAYAVSGEAVLYESSYYRADKYTMKHTLMRYK